MVFEFPSGLNPEMFPLAWLVGKWEGVGEVSYHEEVPTQRVYNVVTFTHDGGPYLKYESVIRILGAGAAPLPGPVLDSVGFDSPEVQAMLNSRSLPSVEPVETRESPAQPTETATTTPVELAETNPSVEPTETRLPQAAETTAVEPAETTPVEPLLPSVEPVETRESPAQPTKTTTEPEHGSELPTPDQIAAAPVWSSETGYWRISPLRDGGMANNEFHLEVFVAQSDGRMLFFNGFAFPARVELASAKVIRSVLSDDIAGSKRMYGYVQDQLAWAEDLVAYGHELGSYFSALLLRTEDGDGKPVQHAQ